MTRFKFLSFALLLLLVAGSALAQEQTAAIQGSVADTSGGVLPGVTIEAVSTRGQRFTAISDSGGNYRFPSIPPGQYTLTASLSGMEPTTIKDLEVRLGQAPRVNITMRLPRVAETISVTAEAPLVDVTSSATATSIRSEAFEKLPKGRDFTSVVTQSASANNEAKGGGIQIDGASGSENVFVVDGVSTTNPQTGTSGKVVITDFVDEVQVKSAGYAAEFGGAIGGVINVITKTGTNNFRGSVNAYYSDNSWAGSERPTLQTNAAGTAAEYVTFRKDDVTSFEPGFSLGGPILRDRLWFFGAYQPIIEETNRTVNFTTGAVNTYGSEFRRENYAATLSGNIGSRLLFKGAYNNSGYEFENPTLPARSGRDNPNARYSGFTDNFDNWTASGYADFIASPQWMLSARGGRFYRNFYQEGYPSDPRIRFIVGSNSTYLPSGHPAIRAQGFTSIGPNSATSEDSYTRDNLYFDVSWFPEFAGTHRLKAGVQIENLDNVVDSGFQNYNILAFWGTTARFTSQMGQYGGAEVYVFKTFGQVTSENTGFFLQDSWTTMNDRLTLNIGVRTEQEKVPNYADAAAGLPPVAFQFDYGDKLAPRLGFSYDVLGNGRWKAFGSYGRFFDIMKMEMPRGSFGGDKWINWQMKIDDPDWTKWTCTNVTTSIKDRPNCTGLSIIAPVDLRHPSLDLIEPDLKPMESEEITLGLQHELSNTMALGFRATRKHLIRTIEDVGILVEAAPGEFHEEYFIANPGSGIARHILGPDLPAMPEAKRDYTGLEFEFTKRFLNRWGLHASYLWSQLEGNYSGLANSDEDGRTSPNVNRAFDSLFNLFSQNGQPLEGKLATDRPHQFKAQLTYALPFGTSIGVNQYVGSGIPITSEFSFHGVQIFPYGRGDLGRTETLSQTDLYLSHDFRLMSRFNLHVGLNVLNLLDQDAVTNVYDVYSSVSVPMYDASGKVLTGHAEEVAYFRGFDAKANLARAGARLDPRYGEPSAFQAPRQVRLQVRFTF